MNDQDILHKINRLARQVCRPSRGITKTGEPTISFTLFKTKYSKGKLAVMIYRCKIIKTAKELKLMVNDKPTDNEDEERIFCLLLELNRFQRNNEAK